ncbi:MAG: hypothetical protein ACYSU4_21440, partial [Planctomycetota bacterium]
MKRLIVRGLFYVIGAVSLIALIGMIQPAMAQLEGPTHNPTYGVDFDDSDADAAPDDQEQWGRTGGRDFTFTVKHVSAYDQLLWQPLNVGIAMDGAINNSSETLNYSNYDSSEQASRYGGSTQIRMQHPIGLYYYLVGVGTRFWMAVTDEGGNEIVPDDSSGVPTLDIKALAAGSDQFTFTVNLRFDASWPANNAPTTPGCPLSSPFYPSFYPALEVYDCLHTDPILIRPVKTTFEHGFFYEIPFLTLFDHDAHMDNVVSSVQGTVNAIDGWTEQHDLDFVGHMNDLYGSHSQTQADIGNLQGSVDGTQGSINTLQDTVEGYGGTVSEIHERVYELQCLDYSQDFVFQNQTLEDQNQTLNTIRDNTENTSELTPTWLLLYLLGLEEVAALFGMEIPEPLPPSITDNFPLIGQSILSASEWYQAIAAVEEKADDLAVQIASLQTALGEATELDIQVKDFESQEVKGKETVTTKRFVISLRVKGVPTDGIITSIDAIVDGEGMSVVPI